MYLIDDKALPLEIIIIFYEIATRVKNWHSEVTSEGEFLSEEDLFCRILKVGVAVYDDAQRLHKDHGLCVRGCVDLRYLAARSRKYKFRYVLVH